MKLATFLRNPPPDQLQPVQQQIAPMQMQQAPPAPLDPRMLYVEQLRSTADLLRQQQDPMQGQMVSGYYVSPSITQGIANLSNAFVAGRLQNIARQQVQQEKAQQQAQLQAFLRAGENVEPLAFEGNPFAQQAMIQAQQDALKSQAELQKIENQERIKSEYNTPASVREYDYAVSQGYDKPFAEFVKDKGAPKTITNVSFAGQDKFTEKTMEQEATQFTDLVNAGQNAQRNLISINDLESLLQQSGSGFAAAAKNIAGNFGIELGENVSEIQAAQAIINRLVPQQRPAGSGQMSDRDLELFKQSLPRIINQAGGNQLIIDSMRNIALYEIEIANIAQSARSGEITPMQAREMMRNLKDPLSLFKAARRLPEGVTLQQFMALDPADRELFK